MSSDGDFVVRRANDGQMKSRYRASAKQTAKNKWQIDVSVETYDVPGVVMTNKEDGSDQKEKTMGEQVLEIIKSVEDSLRADGKQLVSDADKSSIALSANL